MNATTAGIRAVAPALAAVLPPAALDRPGRGVFGGLTTMDQTVVKAATASNGGYRALVSSALGEQHVLRGDLSRRPDNPNVVVWDHPRLALGAFAQMTDLQIVDHKATLRVEFTDRAADPPGNLQGFDTDAAYRPQEFMSTHLVEAMCRAIRNVHRGPMSGLPLAFTVVTGDMVDNCLYNETRWYINLLDGGDSVGAIETDSGEPGIGGSVSYDFGREDGQGVGHDIHYWYSQGVDSRPDTPGVEQDNYQATWGFPTVPGLLAAARLGFRPTGLGMPWYAVMGNHDGEIQGNFPHDPGTITGLLLPDFKELATGSRKPYRSTSPLPPHPGDYDIWKFVSGLVYRTMPADDDRKLLGKDDFVIEHFKTAGIPDGHGFTWGETSVPSLDPNVPITHEGGVTYYAIPSGEHDLVQYVSLDTVNYRGHADGHLDKYQAAWLEGVLKANSSRYYDKNLNLVVRSGVTDKLFVIFSHHTLRTMNNDTDDGPKDGRWLYNDDVKRLLLRFPNVILMVNGHTHANRIEPHPRQELISGSSGGFWEVSTAAHIDWPSQSRIVEITAGKGVISIFTTMLDLDAPVSNGGDLSTPTALASLARELAANDPTERPERRDGYLQDRRGRSDVADRNTQLLVTAPFPLGQLTPAEWGSSIAAGSNADTRLEVFGTKADDAVIQRYQPTVGSDDWTAGWWQFPGTLRAVASETFDDGRLAVFGANVLGDVWYAAQETSGGWSAWKPLGAADARSIAVARNFDGRLDVYVTTSIGDIRYTWQTEKNTHNWAGWTSGFGMALTNPFAKIAAHPNKDGRITVVAVTFAGEVWKRTQIINGASITWGGWSTFNNTLSFRVTAIAAAGNKDGRIELYVVDQDWRVSHIAQSAPDAATWGAWTLLDFGTTRMTQLAARRKGQGRIWLFGVDATGRVWYRQQTADNAFSYTPWADFGGGQALRADVPVPPPGSGVGEDPPEPVVVPYVMWSSQGQAEDTIQAAGLVVGDVRDDNTCQDRQNGIVVMQHPQAGSGVPRGSAVDLDVSTGHDKNGKQCPPDR